MTTPSMTDGGAPARRFFPALERTLFVLALLLAMSRSYAAAQDRRSLTGVVVDQSGAPIAGASVTLLDDTGASRARTTTTQAGEFTFSLPSAGTFTVLAEQSLFRPARTAVEIVEGAAVPSPRLTLEVDALREQVSVVAPASRPLQLDAVTDSASRLGLTSREIAGNVEVLSQARIQELGARSTVEALNRSAGVTFSLTPNGPVRLNIRGFSSDAVSVLYDGMRAVASGSQSRNQDSWTFDRIEVLSGPASVLYGEGALAGVVNFVPKRAVVGQRSAAGLFSGGNLATLRAAGDVNVPLGSKVAIRALASTNHSGGYIDDTDSSFTSSSLSARVQPSDRLTVDVAVDYSGDELETSYYGTPLVPASIARDASDIVQTANGLVLDRSLRTSNFNVENPEYGADTTTVRSEVRYRINNAFRFTNLFSHYDSQHRFVDNAINFTYAAATQLVNRARSTVINDFQFWAERPVLAGDFLVMGHRNRMSVGSEFSHLTSSSFRRLGATYPAINPYAPVRGLAPANQPPSAFPTATTEDSTVSIAALFAEEAFNLSPRWLVAGGLRYEQSDVDRTTLDARTNLQGGFTKSFDPMSWRVGTVFDLTPSLQIYAQRSSAVVPVSGLTLLPLASAAFDLTTGLSVEGGVKNTLFGGRADLTVATFRIAQENIITRDPNDPNISIQGGRRSSRGIEMAASAAVTPRWRIDGSFTALDSRFDELLEAGGVSRAGATPPGMPETVATLFSIYAFEATPLSITGTLRHEGRTFLDNANTVRVNGRRTLDASVGYRFRMGDLTLRGRNLTDQLYADGASPSVNQVVLGPPRTIDLTFTLHSR